VLTLATLLKFWLLSGVIAVTLLLLLRPATFLHDPDSYRERADGKEKANTVRSHAIATINK